MQQKTRKKSAAALMALAIFATSAALSLGPWLRIVEAQFIDRIVRPCSAGAVLRASVIVNPGSNNNIDVTPCTGGSLTVNGVAVVAGGMADPGSNGIVVRTAAGVTTARTITASNGVSITNGDGVAGAPAIAGINAAADGATKGVATFTAADFNATAAVISIDYTNGQAASAGAKGFLISADWSTFNSKQAAITFGTGVLTALGVNIGSAGAPVLNGGALGSPLSVGTLPAFTLGGTIAGGGNQINNVIIGTSTPLAGAFTTLSATGIGTITGQGLNISGASTQSWGAAFQFIQLGGNGGWMSQNARQTGNTFQWFHNAYFDGTNIKYISSEGAGRILMDGATPQVLLQVAPSGTAGNNVTFATGIQVGALGTVFTPNLTSATGTPGSVCYNTSTFEVTKNNALTCTVSAREYKSGITSLKSGLDILLQMKPSQFVYKDNPKRSRWGFMADDLQAVNSRLGDGYDAKGHAQSIDIPGILAVNTKAIQELHAIVIAQQKEIAKLKKQGR